MSLYVEYTNPNGDNAVICGRPDCDTKVFPPGTELKYLHSQVPGEAGRAVCPKCFGYYAQKRTTVRREEEACSQKYEEDRQRTHASIAKAQRGEHGARLQILPQGISHQPLSMGPPPPVYQTTGILPMATYQYPNGPMVQMPGFQVPGGSAGPIALPGSPALMATSNGGYTQSHLSYDNMKRRMMASAYSGQGGKVVVVRVQIVEIPDGRARPKIIGPLVTSQDNIPVHIGAAELKQILYTMIIEEWNTYTLNFPLHINDIIMRTGQGVPIRPPLHPNPDCDAISHNFFKPNKTGDVKFKVSATPFLINFHVPNDLVRRMEDHRETIIEEKEALRVKQALLVATPSIAQNLERGKDRMKRKMPDDDIEGETSIENFSSKDRRFTSGRTLSTPRELTNRTTSIISPPSKTRLREVIQAQRPANMDPNLLNWKKNQSLLALVHPVLRIPFNDLVNTADAISVDVSKLLDAPMLMNLSWNTATKKYGGFKVAYFGRSSQRVFKDVESTEICLKQAYYKKDVISSKTLQPATHRLPYDTPRQTKEIGMEITCLVWADALLSLVYDYVHEHEKLHGRAPFPIPQMRFVKAALALGQDGTESNAYLVEEVLQDGNGNHEFRKFINNDSALAFQSKDVWEQLVGEFLEFTQHVQYWKTGKLVFVSDYQGVDVILSDPQIVTAKDLGIVFASGNLPRTHEKFETDHVCHRVCKWHNVPTDYENWGFGSAESVDNGLSRSQSRPLSLRSLSRDEEDEPLSVQRGVFETQSVPMSISDTHHDVRDRRVPH